MPGGGKPGMHDFLTLTFHFTSVEGHDAPRQYAPGQNAPGQYTPRQYATPIICHQRQYATGDITARDNTPPRQYATLDNMPRENLPPRQYATWRQPATK